MEDKMIYPRMLLHSSLKVREMEFTGEMKGILDALTARIRLENKNLYSLIDRERSP